MGKLPLKLGARRFYSCPGSGSFTEFNCTGVNRYPMFATLNKKTLQSAVAIASIAGVVMTTLPTLTNVAAAKNATSKSVNCVPDKNLNAVADYFIRRCFKASIKTEFPSDLLQRKIVTIKTGKTAAEKKAWKLLNDKRFKN